MIDEKTTLSEAIEDYGIHSQFVIAMEEMAELTQALSKRLRGAQNVENIAEEIADVEIMIAQIKLALQIAPDVRRIRAEKAQRLRDRLLASAADV